MKKIAFFGGDISHTGGTERVSIALANYLVKEGYQVVIISLSGNMPPKFHVDENIKLVSLFDKKRRFSLAYFSVVFRLRRIIVDESIDMLIDVDTMLALFSTTALLGTKIKHISWEHFNYKSNLNIKSRKLARKVAAKYSDVIVTLTEKDRSYWLEENKYPEKIISIFNPLPFEPQKKLTKKNNKIVLALGRLNYQKGFDLLLDVWAKVEKTNNSWTLIIVGDGEDKELLLDKIKRLNLKNVKLLPSTPHVNELYNQSSIYVMTSRFEGFPMVLLEAKASGLPIIAYDCDTGPSELIINNEDGFLIPFSDSNAFARQLILLMNDDDLRESMSLRSLKNAEKYKIEVVIGDKWKNLIENI
ncbi:TPA: glycosyltransferase family 4 protein [Yersinia enterocolitica]|uniref:glycosyltransferase family 4 protein n=1 Tax=Yersinia enterocolitica TaxID=630 RepID=UPI0029B72B65|nr:glycosyltransferase family 4 protein [Yersinia enterocolitica]EMA9250640.1 glycosyltransferase family 4 protein [Yersinia enterocolitica]EMA9425785.1 glycosyltransferase family 4 protein [Yersinia enterocolitica]HDL7801862.1 glycosyltransferase family 4 protein [Yersinia enterocolitica]HEI6711573.1 glycosyltransferase family 4 protein [Yersinia enterocolitica]